MRYQAIMTRERRSSSRRTGRHSKYSIKDPERLKKNTQGGVTKELGKGNDMTQKSRQVMLSPCCRCTNRYSLAHTAEGPVLSRLGGYNGGGSAESAAG